MATCPNKNLQEWKDLVYSRGEDKAYFLWNKYDGKVPEDESTLYGNTEVLAQVEGSEGQEVSEGTVQLIRDAAKKMGIKINTLTKYAEAHPDIDVNGINGLADLFNGVVAIAHGMEGVALTEEVVHIATAIMEQTNPKLITNLISKIGKYKIYQETFDKYKGREEYQINGKPNIRKIKKEAVDKLIVEAIIAQEEGTTLNPEQIDRPWLQEVWDSILESIRALFKNSDVGLLQRVGEIVTSGDVGGKVNDFNLNDIYLQATRSNEAVDSAYDTAIAVHDRIKLIPEVKDAQGEVITRRHYTFDGVEVARSVTEMLNEKKSFKPTDATDKMLWGIEGHNYLEMFIENNLTDENGFVIPRSQRKITKVSTSLNASVQEALEQFAIDLVESYPVGTRILTEVRGINENYKGGLAGTIDFQAFVPSKDKNGKDTVKLELLDWKFTSFDSNKHEDLGPQKQKDWKAQMSEYVKMQSTGLYKHRASEISKARMVPFISKYTYNIPGVATSGLFLSEIEVGNIDPKKENKIYLLPVPINEETSGNSEVDELVHQLEKQKSRMYSRLRSPQERLNKDAELAAITRAIKKLRIQLDFDPLYTVGLNAIKNIDKSLKEYEKTDFIQGKNVDSVLGDMLEFRESLEKFIDLRTVYNDYIGKDSDELTPEEKMTKRKIERISLDSSVLNRKVIDLQNKFAVEFAVKKGITTEDTKDDILKPENKITWLAYSFSEGTRLSQKIIVLGSNLLLNAKKLVDVIINKKIKNYTSLVAELETLATSLGVKAFDLIGRVEEKDLQLYNKIDSDYYVKQREAIKNNDTAFFKKNMDVAAYKEMVAEIKKERYAIYDDTIYSADKEENDARIKLNKANLNNQINIYSPKFYGINNKYFLYIYRQNFLEDKHYSEDYKTLLKNEPALKVWEYLMELNKDARDLGYLTSERQSFFPLIEATSIQKLQQTNHVGRQFGDFFTDVFTSRINESMDYNTEDPETGERRKSIPKYFTRTDKNVEQLSRDLNLVGTLWIKSVESYKSNKQLENILLTLHTVEKAKGVRNPRGGKAIANTYNADVFEKIIDDGLYNLKESESSTGNKIINFSANKLTNNEEQEEKLGLNVRKTIGSANDLVRLLALGLKYTLGVANYVGTQMQTLVKSGEFYTFKEYELNHGRVMFSNLGTLTTVKKGLLDLFVPLNEDIATEARRHAAYKEGYLKYLSTWSFSDVLMLTMQFPEKKLQFANALSFLDNTMVENGKLVNIRQFLKQQDRIGRKDKTFEERKEMKDTFEDRVKALKDTRALDKIATVSDDGLVIPGVTIEEIGEYRTKIIDFNRTLNGMMDENDKMGYRRDTIFSSFMMFKSWIPKLVSVRTQGLEKNIQTGNYEYGRMRAFGKALLSSNLNTTDLEAEASKSFISTWNGNIFQSVNNISEIIKGTDKGMEILNRILYAKKVAHLRETGQELTISEEEFQDVMRDAIVNQFKEIGILMAVMGSYVGALVSEPPEDATALERNRHKQIFKMINKISDEITFYYNPTSTEAMLQGTFIPALGLGSRIIRFGSQLTTEVWGEATDNQDLIDASHPTKYLFNLIPVLSHVQNEYLPFVDPELAKEMGIRVTKESRK